MLNIKTLEYQAVVSQLGNLPTENFIFSYTLQTKQNTAQIVISVILRWVRARTHTYTDCVDGNAEAHKRNLFPA